ncbi:butyrophilin-like protein 2 [Rhynchocyon petersi]
MSDIYYMRKKFGISTSYDYLILAQIPFEVVAPQAPIVALLGEDVDLPCHLSPSMNAEHMELRWFRDTFSPAVLVYWDRKEQEGEQMPEYRGRVTLVKDDITAGHVAVRIHGVKASDEGMYTCSFRAQQVSEEAFMHLKVTASFDVVAPQEPILALVGEDVDLPCHLSPSISAEHMELRWFRDTFSPAVLVYRDGEEQEGEQMPEYRDRVSMVKDDITLGQVAVRIHGVKASDDGTYQCSFTVQQFYEDNFMHLEVAASFDVVAPQEPILALVGEDVDLPCHLSPSISAEHMELRWFWDTFSPAVLVYRDGEEQEGEQMPEYRDRVSMVKDNITVGQVAVRIHGVKASDKGMYQCSFTVQQFYEDNFMHLEVAAIGSDPHISMEVQKSGQVQLKCSSSGWYPKPQVQWRTPKGEVFPSTSESSSPDEEGLYTVTASLAISSILLKSVSCLIQNDHVRLEKEATGQWNQ